MPNDIVTNQIVEPMSVGALVLLLAAIVWLAAVCGAIAGAWHSWRVRVAYRRLRRRAASRQYLSLADARRVYDRRQVQR